MAEHFYTTRDRERQLEELARAMGELIPVVRGIPEFSGRACEYERALTEVERLRREGFDQGQLSALSRSVPDLFYRFKEWSPPSERLPDGTWREPEWFTGLEAKLQPALAAARRLGEIGYY